MLEVNEFGKHGDENGEPLKTETEMAVHGLG